MAWPTRTAESVLSGENVEAVGLDLWDRDSGVMQIGVPFWFDSVTVNFGSWTTVASRIVRCPGWAKTGAVCSLAVSVGSAGADLRLVVGSITGSTVTPSAAGVAVVSATAADDSWADALITITLEGQQNTASSSVECHIVCALYWEI